MSDIQKDIESFEDPKIRRVLLQLYGNLLVKEEEIIVLQSRVTELETRVLENEKYMSKDCLIFENMPRTDDSMTLSQQGCEFLKICLNHNTNPANFKACHELGRGKGIYPPAVIVKFIYFGDKNEIFLRKSWLARARNPKNGRPIFIKERLPNFQKELKEHAESMDIVTTTNNCNIKVFTKTTDGSFKSVTVNTKKAINDIKSEAVVKQRASSGKMYNKPADPKTPERDKDIDDNNLLKRVAKRIRESPGDGVAVLKQFCLDTRANMEEETIPKGDS